MDGNGDKPRIDTTDPSLALIVGRLVEAFHPEKVYLFGSHARGEAGPDSDYDIAVILSNDAPTQLSSTYAYRVLRGTGIAADVIVWRRKYFDDRVHLRASLPGVIQEEGHLLYAA
jgi:uncharacterized protein